MKILLGLLVVTLLVIGAALVALMLRFRRNQRRADEAWASFEPQPLDLEPIERLTILPLVDARIASEGLMGGPGVSYSIQADDVRLLFDLGLSGSNAPPSLLQHNMSALGVDLDAVDAVVISHRHYDHVGGFKAQLAHSFVLPTEHLEKGDVPVYVPEPLQHPTANVCVVDGARLIASGVASLGPISRALFVLGWTPEQALAVNLAGKGIVLIVGCGHQGVQRIVERAEALFDEPLYGLVGGLHLPVTGSGMQRFLGTGRPPWQSLTTEDATETIHYLLSKGLKRIALSAHDSCDWTLNAFKEAYGAAFQVVTVGQPLEFSGNGDEQ
jgi:7,8-dihydropterin-6-yl-methyl-4-(beta-D-ribofuranosyl)aminobenzene 5'-phosphate synthase